MVLHFPPRTEIPDDELAAATSIPAPYANRMYLSGMGGVGFRISFAEQRGAGLMPVPRAAVFLTVADTIALRDLLTDQLQHAVQVQPIGDADAPETT